MSGGSCTMALAKRFGCAAASFSVIAAPNRDIFFNAALHRKAFTPAVSAPVVRERAECPSESWHNGTPL
jgi:hypothetical protein